MSARCSIRLGSCLNEHASDIISVAAQSMDARAVHSPMEFAPGYYLARTLSVNDAYNDGPGDSNHDMLTAMGLRTDDDRLDDDGSNDDGSNDDGDEYDDA